MKPIYIAALGDAWLSKDSLNVIGYYSTEKKAYKALRDEVEKRGEYGIYHKDKNGDHIDFETFGCYDIEVVNINERY